MFEKFLKEKRYLANVTDSTAAWYNHALSYLPTETPTADQLKDAVLRMRERGRKATGCNSSICAINVYLKWLGSPLKIPYLKEPELILPTFTLPQVASLTRHRPKTFYARRLHLTALILLDTGCRIDEALSLTVSDCDSDSLLLTVTGKGRKQRRIPFSFELRRSLVRYIIDYKLTPANHLLGTRNGRKLARRNVLRDTKALCRQLGFTPPARTLHAFRHTFALNYIRRGGSVFHLQKVLGHSSLEMTMRYVHLVTEDIQKIHQSISLLAA